MARRTSRSPGKKSPPQDIAFYRSIIDNQTEFIIRFCPDGRLTFVNQAYCRYLGKGYDELVGQNFLHMLQENDRETMQDILSSLTLEGPVNTIKVRFIKPDGKAVRQHWTNRAIFNGRGVLIACQAVGHDITDRKEILLSSSLYRTLFETAPVGLGIADMQGNLIAFNDAMLNPGGYNREDITKIMNVSAFYYDLKEREKILEIFRKQGFLHQHLVQFKRKDGTPYYTLLSLRPAAYAGKACLQAMVEDVDKKKKLENALVRSEERSRNLFEYAPIALCELDLSALRRLLHKWESETGDLGMYLENNMEAMKECLAGIKIIDVNNAMLKLFKAKTKQEFIENRADIFQPGTYNTFTESILSLTRGKGRSEHEAVAQTFAGDTIRIFVNWFVSLGCEETLSSVILSVVDLTAIKSMKEELMQTEKKLAKLLETMNEGFATQDKDGVLTYVNEKFCRMLGYPRSELLGMFITDFLDRPNRDRFKKQMAGRRTGSARSYDLEWLAKNGAKVYTFISPQPLYDQAGQYIGSFGTLTDITERKRLQEERDMIFNISCDLICIAGMDGYFKFLNPSWERTLGYPVEVLLSRPFLDFIHPDDHQKNDAEVATLAAGKATTDFENRYIHKDGSVRTISWTAMPLPEKGLIYCFGRDITERKKNDELILSYQKQLSLLASKLSLLEEKERRKTAADLHDNIGQILACAKIKLGELKESAGADLRDALLQIQELLDQSIMFTRSLTSELSVPVLYEIGLESAVEWIGKKYQKQHGLQFRLKDDGKVKPLNHDTRIILFKAIRESLTNVVKHANAHNVTVAMERKGHSIQVTVEDDGEGFDPAGIYGGPFIENRFGLFMLREALNNIGGSVNITSAPGSPTRITLTAPLAED